MSLEVSVSDCFNKHLRTLNLNEFPCIDGKKVEEIDPQVDELLDLIRDQKSPWHRKFEWSSNCDSIREIFIKSRRSLKTGSIEKYFTNLRFNDQEISLVDNGLKKFVNLTDLILTCNRLRALDFSNLPSTLKVLDLSGNLLNDFQVPPLTPRSPKIEHLGLALNWLRYFSAADSFASTLVSLDLSHNQIRDLVALRNELVKMKLLKNLVLYGNPIVLLPGYRGCFIDSMPKLFSLDDKPITRNERINYLDFNLIADDINKQTEIVVSFNQLKNLIVLELPDFEDSLEIYVYKYVLRFYSIDDEFMREEGEQADESRMLYSMITYKTKTTRSNCYRIKAEDTEELEPAVNIDLNEKGIIKLRFKSIDQLRDFFLDGTRIELIERKIDYQSKDFNKDDATTTATGSDKTGKKKKESSSKASEAVNKGKDANKKKKKKMTLLDNFNKTNVEDKVVASFEIQLNELLDGHVKEMSRKFTAKLPPIETPEIKPPPSGTKKKKDTSKKVTSANLKDTKKKQAVESPPEVVVEPPPLELDFRLQVLDFASYKDAKRHFEDAKQLLKQ